MGFWSVFKPIAKVAAGVAAPFTAGASLAAIPAIDALGGAGEKATDAMAANRGTQLDVEFEKLREQRQQEDQFFNQLLAREQERRTAGGDAWKRLQQASYLSNWSPSTGNVSPYTRALKAPANDVVAMARSPEMWAELSKRAAYQDPYAGDMAARTPDFSGVEKRRNSSVWEKILGPASAAASIYGSLAGAGKGTK